MNGNGNKVCRTSAVSRRAAGFLVLAMVLAAGLLTGCEKPASSPPSQPASVNTPVPPPPPPPPPPAPPMVQEKAGVGVGAKGRGYGQGVIATPAASLFAAQERIVFEMKIPHTMNLFKAQEGRAPKTHEEFMDRIIKENQIQLPELPEGHRYVYDPKTEQLMVEKPAF